MQQTGDPIAARQMTLKILEDTRDQQALSLAYFDVFWALSAVSLVMIGLVFFMRRSVAEKGAHIAAE